MRLARTASNVAETASPSASRLDSIDPAAVGRGAWRGFAVLLLGGLSAPAVFAAQPSVGQLWPTMIAVAAFVVAAWRPGGSADARWFGLFAAVGAYMLIIPMQLVLADATSAAQIATTLLLASTVGVATGVVRRTSNAGQRR